MLDYSVLQPIRHSGTDYAIGGTIPAELLTIEQTKALLDVGAIDFPEDPPLPIVPPEPRTEVFLPEADQTVTVGAVAAVLTFFNTASEPELIDLPHVGTVTAGKLLAQRPYNATNDARAAAGLSDAKWAEILTYLEKSNEPIATD
ncbi:MAG: hypothetical protein AAGD09_11570 [Cyanobacteria bacterium P01_F01_bin.56]